MNALDHVARGRDAYQRRAWDSAVEAFSAADASDELPPEDLERLATAAYMAGRADASSEAWARAHSARKRAGDLRGAARCAFWLAFGEIQNSRHARASGWLSRAERMLEDVPDACVEEGYVLLPRAVQLATGGDPKSSRRLFERAAEIAERFQDADLYAMARNGLGRVLIRLGEVDEGVGLLDEAMAAVEAGEVSPVVAGSIYCTVIEGCHEVFDVQRAREWTMALDRWCERQPGLVMYRGQCLIRRSEVLRLNGTWSEALADVQEACDWLTRPPRHAAAGLAFYEKAELHRLRGEYPEAKDAYHRAAEIGRSPHPGLALLWLAQGDVEAAVGAVRRALGDAAGPHDRAGLLQADVEISLAADDVPAAERSSRGLAEIATDVAAPYLRACAEYTRGRVLLAKEEHGEAVSALKRSFGLWTTLDAPYQTAQARQYLAAAYLAVGDVDTAEIELATARDTFLELGATPALEAIERIESAYASAAGTTDHELTPRELEVLRLVAAGATNREIASELEISVRTVERHVSNILDKFGVPSRTAATARAYERDIL